MTDLDKQIIAYFRFVPAASAQMVAGDMGLNERTVQDAMRDLDDAGFLIMRNGWYRLSEAAKIKSAKGLDDFSL